MDITLTIDDKLITVQKGTTVYQAAKSLGIDLPIFCYQDRMPPFGACRVCLVEVDKMPKLQTSCTLECTEGMVVRTQANPAVKAREEILEFLLINHPLDCPICDRGGECPLQDQALSDGPGKSRFYEEKRHFEKGLELGPVLTLDRERCITCARCTRFGDIVAGDHALEFIERGYKSEVGTSDGGAPKSKFIGNTIAICPVGALTSSVYRFRARPWDNLATETTCTLCPVGCSMYLDSRDGEIMRTRAKETPALNDIWLCDKGWFGYEFSSSDKRLKEPMIRKNGTLVAVSWDEAFSYVAEKCKAAKKAAAFGGNTLTMEENYLLQQLMRDCLGSNNLDHRLGLGFVDDSGFTSGLEMQAGDIEQCKNVLLLGVDITEEFPVLWLKLKLAINKGCKVTYAGHYEPEIARYMHKTIIHAPHEEHQILDTLKSTGQECDIFIGRQYLASTNRQALLQEIMSWQPKSLNLLEGSNNSLGARFSGMHPEYGPQGKKLEKPGKDALTVLKEASESGWDLLYAVGCDVASKVPDELFTRARSKIGCLIVQDLFMTKTAEQADVVLPTLSFVEKGGSFLNIEGRIQKLKPGKSIPKGIYADSYIFVRIAHKLNQSLVIDEAFLHKLKPGRLHPIRPKRLEAATPATSQPKGLVATLTRALFDHGIRMQHNDHVKQLAKEEVLLLHPDDAKRHNIQDGKEVTVTIGSNSIQAKVTLSPKVAKNTLVIPRALGYKLTPNPLNGQEVSIK